jgi:Protein of unknown function (DUF632)
LFWPSFKAEEKMRLLLAKNTKKLRLLDERGAEAQKIDATRNLVRKLSTKIRIAIQVVNSISHKINKVRDEELCPQLNALIRGYILSNTLFHKVLCISLFDIVV